MNQTGEIPPSVLPARAVWLSPIHCAGHPGRSPRENWCALATGLLRGAAPVGDGTSQLDVRHPPSIHRCPMYGGKLAAVRQGSFASYWHKPVSRILRYWFGSFVNVCANGCFVWNTGIPAGSDCLLLNLRQCNGFLPLVLALIVLVAALALTIRAQEQQLRDAFIGVYLRRQRGGVADLER